MQRKATVKTLTISDDLLHNALEMTHERIVRCEVSPGYVEYVTPCASGKHGHHTVTATAGRVVCDCAAYGTCKHILASIGRLALHALAQLRWAQDLEWLEAVVEIYAPAVRELPESLRSLVRREWHHRAEMIRRSGAMAGRQENPPEHRAGEAAA